MKLRNHLFLVYISTSFWTWFFIGGLWSGYYQNWPFVKSLLIVDVLPTIFLAFAGKGLLKTVAKSNFFKSAVISATYIAFVLLFYDFVYLKLYLEKDFYYLIDYWYLTFFTPVPYLVLLPIGYQLDRKNKKSQ